MLAVAALASCMKEQTIATQQPGAIAFDNAIVENATRAALDPSTTTAKLNAFDVWAFMGKPDGTIFEGEDVKGSGHEWSYANTQYWTPGNTYYFAAFAPMNSANWTLDTTNANYDGAGVVSFTNVDGSEDLLYAATTATTPKAEILTTQGMEKVKFQFNHLLSKVKFTFENGFTTDNVYVVVKDVKMTAPKAGTLALNTADWWTGDKWALGTENFQLAFGDVEKLAMGKDAEAAAERLSIPASKDYVYEITFTVELYMGEVLAMTSQKVSTVAGVALEMGKAYNFAAVLDASNVATDGNELHPIEFDVTEVKEWVEAGTTEFMYSTPVATAEELVAAIEAGENVILTQDLDIDAVAMTKAAHSGLVLASDIEIDGNGHSISTTAVRAILVDGAKKVTIKNLTLNAPQSERGFQLQGEGETLVLENVVAYSANRTVNVTGTATNANVSIKNCELHGLTTINVWGENHTVVVENTSVYVEDNNSNEDYSAVYNVAENTTIEFNGGKVVIAGTAAENTVAALTSGTAKIVFNGTEGDLTFAGAVCAINYGKDRYTFETVAEAVAYAKDGETIVLLNDVTETITVDVDKKITLDLNGKNISTEGDAIVVSAGELTIKGEGVVYAATTNTEPWCAVWAHTNGKVNIEGGEFKVGYPEGDYNDLIYAKDNAVINISGGKFYNSGKVGAFVLNLKDNSNAVINVTGGKFEKFNPAENASENPQKNFIVAGTVEQDGDWYIVK